MDWTEILQPAFQAVAVALGTALTGVLVQVLRKYNIELAEAQQEKLRHAAINAVLAVEERAARSLKKAEPSEKANQALDLVINQMGRVDVDKAREAIDAALPVTGLGAAGKPQPSR